MRALTFLLLLAGLSLQAQVQTPATFAEALAQLQAAEAAGDVQLIRTALYQVGRFKDAAVVELLAGYLTHADTNLRYAAINALQTNASDDAVAVLRATWLGNDATLSSQALRCLSILGRGYSLEEMLPLLSETASHRYAADAIAALGGLESFQALFASLVPVPPIELRSAEDKAAQGRNSHGLKLLKAYQPTEPAPWLLESCFTKKSPIYITENGLTLLIHWKWADAAETAAGYTKAKLPGLRAAGCELLGEVGAAEFDAELAKCTKDKDPSVALAAGRALGSTDTAAARKALKKLLKKREWELRAIAVHSLGRYRDPALLEDLSECLDDKAWQVQVAAIKAVGNIPAPEAVEALIAQLDKTEARMHFEVVLALKRLTGEDVGEAAQDWNNWWQYRKDGFVFPDEEARVATGAALPPATRERGSYYGTEIVSNRVCFLVDISGSMSGQLRGTEYTGIKLDVAKSELIKAIEGLPKSAFFNIILFDNGTQPWQGQLTRATPASLADARTFIEACSPRGGTNIYDPLEEALLDDTVDTIYLLTDGSPGSGKYTAADDILREVAKINAVRNIQINTINFAGNAQLLKALADQNSGVYVNID